ncbi:MAG: nitrogenase component 1, partial [Anaerotignaceae bacterium]
FIGVGSTCKTLRMIAQYFGDPELIKRTEEVIAEELEAISDDMEYYKSMLKGKTAGIFSGGSRSHHYQLLLEDFGIETIISGYEFAHRDDYEGRHIISEIKPDADSKNIEEIKVSKDPELFKERYTAEQIEELKAKGVEIDEYEGMFPDMVKGSMALDDYNAFETDELVESMKPDIFLSGIKDKYSIQKTGVVSRQIHSYDYSGPYSGFNGAVQFGKDVTMSIYTNAWSLVVPPWKTEPMLTGKIGGDGVC